MAHDHIIDLYERDAREFDRDRRRSLQERTWIDRFLQHVPSSGRILDMACGMGEPIGRYLIGAGRRLVGIDSSPSLIAMCRSRFPAHEWLVADMRALALGSRFDGIVAWDSFFHLHPDHQRAMRFASHAHRGAPLMFTSGPFEGESIGSYCDEPLYHASLSAVEYEDLLVSNGFRVAAHVENDADCWEHTVWLATCEGPS